MPCRADLKRQARELLSRLTRLYGETGRFVGRPTADQQSEFTFYQEMVTKLTAAAAGVWGLGFGVWGLGFGVWGLGFGAWGLGLEVLRF